jgi:hypothetical protein
MFSATTSFRLAVFAAALLGSATIGLSPARAQDGFPFGFAMTLDASRMPGSKRVPNLDIGDSGETEVELWCKGGKGQFSVAGDTVIFVPGPIQDRNCPEAKAQADDDLLAALGAVETWKRQGDYVTFGGPKPLRFHLNTN